MLTVYQREQSQKLSAVACMPDKTENEAYGDGTDSKVVSTWWCRAFCFLLLSSFLSYWICVYADFFFVVVFVVVVAFFFFICLFILSVKEVQFIFWFAHFTLRHHKKHKQAVKSSNQMEKKWGENIHIARTHTNIGSVLHWIEFKSEIWENSNNNAFDTQWTITTTTQWTHKMKWDQCNAQSKKKKKS